MRHLNLPATGLVVICLVFTLADQVGATSIVAVEDGVVETLTDGRVRGWSGEGVSIRSADASFVYGFEERVDGPENVVFDLDGAEVCRTDADVLWATRDADGSVVAAIEESTGSPGDPAPAPTFALTCDTGDRQPIEPRNLRGDEGRLVALEPVGEGELRLAGTAEGGLTEATFDGRSLLDDDLIGRYDVDANRKLLAYTDHSQAANLDSSRTVEVRSIESGELLWSADLDEPVATLSFSGDRLVVSGQRASGSRVTPVLFLEPMSGSTLADFDVIGRLLYIE